jgi:TetR/AcrR family transcriptional regulator, mexJK operon transcriptional repressor
VSFDEATAKTILESIVSGKEESMDGSLATISEAGVAAKTRRRAKKAAMNGDATRQVLKQRIILRGAKAVFLSRGFAGANMDAVAAKAGVSKMTLYRHFSSKEALFAGVINQLCGEIVDLDLERVFEQAPKQALRAFAEKMIAIVFARETVELHRIVIAESRRFPELGRLFYDTGPANCVGALARYFRRHRGDRRLNIVEPRRSAEEFLELLRGYAHLRLLLGLDKRPSARDIKARIDSAVGHVLR